MKRSTGLLAVAALSLSGAMIARAAPTVSVNDAAITDDAMPAALADYGFFADAPAQVPASGVTPYRLNTPLYSDGAEKLRFLYLPPGKAAKANGEGLLELPVGTALVKTFAFRENGKRRLIETRVLMHRDAGWVALPYLWNASQTEARLALAGARVPVTTPDGEAISYRVPNKNQCKECHGLEGAVTPIGPKVRNLSREWLAQQVADGRLDRVPEGADTLPVWEERLAARPEAAARAYLEANCAHCHQPGATASNSGLDLRWEQRDPHAIGIGKRPVAAGRGSGANMFDIVPGKPDQSILVHRMASEEPGVAMPELGKASVDEDGVEAVRRWIEGMAP